MRRHRRAVGRLRSATHTQRRQGATHPCAVDAALNTPQVCDVLRWEQALCWSRYAAGACTRLTQAGGSNRYVAAPEFAAVQACYKSTHARERGDTCDALGVVFGLAVRGSRLWGQCSSFGARWMRHGWPSHGSPCISS